ncbi:caspase family protein [Microcystis aeruginosa]|uniref:caspase family protein n=1 Tax=Microcystis aeruginosa TaxID=1126 RepID=UPI00232F428C|nr:caspase family protein [Microcystis aeruginosa]MDB9433221.1 caspase family protein [Microcystis aeruginosa CS-552/01]
MAKFALLIGVSEYSEGLRPISSAILDVEAMRRVLEHPDMGAFDQVTVLSNPDNRSMERAVEDLFTTHIPHPQLSQIKKAIKVVHNN